MTLETGPPTKPKKSMFLPVSAVSAKNKFSAEQHLQSQAQTMRGKPSKPILMAAMRSSQQSDREGNWAVSPNIDSAGNLNFNHNLSHAYKSSLREREEDQNDIKGYPQKDLGCHVQSANILKKKPPTGHRQRDSIDLSSMKWDKEEEDYAERKSIRLVPVILNDSSEHPGKKVLLKKIDIAMIEGNNNSSMISPTEKSFRKSFKAKKSDVLSGHRLHTNNFFATLDKEKREHRLSTEYSPSKGSGRADHFDLSMQIDDSMVANSDRGTSPPISPKLNHNEHCASTRTVDVFQSSSQKGLYADMNDPRRAIPKRIAGSGKTSTASNILNNSRVPEDSGVSHGNIHNKTYANDNTILYTPALKANSGNAKMIVKPINFTDLTRKTANHDNNDSMIIGAKPLDSSSPKLSIQKPYLSNSKKSSEQLSMLPSPQVGTRKSISTFSQALSCQSPKAGIPPIRTLNGILGGSSTTTIHAQNQFTISAPIKEKSPPRKKLPPKPINKLMLSREIVGQTIGVNSDPLQAIMEVVEPSINGISLVNDLSKDTRLMTEKVPSLQILPMPLVTEPNDPRSAKASTPQPDKDNKESSTPDESPSVGLFSPEIYDERKSIYPYGQGLNQGIALEGVAATAYHFHATAIEKYEKRGREKYTDEHNNSAFIERKDYADDSMMIVNVDDCEHNKSMDLYDKNMLDVPTNLGNNSNAPEFADQDTKDSVEPRLNGSLILDELTPKAPEPIKVEAERIVDKIMKANPTAKFLALKVKDFFTSRDGKHEMDYKTPISNYELVTCIGKGSFGKVHQGLQVLTCEHVAIKVISKKSLALDDNGKKKVEAEIYLLMKASKGKGVIQLLEVVESKEYYFLITEFAAQGDLGSLIKKKMCLSEEECRGIFVDVVEALDSLHKQHIVHRDVKLDNILLTKEGYARLADLGISKQLKISEKLTEPAGTPAYQAPESISLSQYDGYGADIWGLGIMLYHLVYGKVPFRAETIPEIYVKITKSDLVFPAKPETSPELKDLIRRILQKDPIRRINLNEIKSHLWLENFHDSRQTPPRELANGLKKDDLAMNIVRQLGFPKRYLLDSLRQSSFNHATACFNVLISTLHKK